MKKVATLVLLALVVILFLSFFNKKGSLIFFNQSLKYTVDRSLAGTEGRYAVYIKNLKSGESYSLREDEVFDAGSLYKLWVMGEIFEKIKEGNLKGDDSVEANIEDLNRQYGIDAETAELTEGTLQFSILSAVEQMITISHNYAALSLLTRASQGEIQIFINTLGLKNSRMKFPSQTSAADIGRYFEKLYKGEVIDADYSKQMLEVLSRQKINDRIPKLLPAGTKVAHKTADLGKFEHDAGIVYSEKGDYIIVVLSESDSPAEAGEKIANLSQAVFNYFNR